MNKYDKLIVDLKKNIEDQKKKIIDLEKEILDLKKQLNIAKIEFDIYDINGNKYKMGDIIDYQLGSTTSQCWKAIIEKNKLNEENMMGVEIPDLYDNPEPKSLGMSSNALEDATHG